MYFPLEAQDIILQQAKMVGYEIVHISNALGRIAFEDVFSNRRLPAMDNSAMDGYVFRWCDYEKGMREFRVNGVIKAGDDVSHYLVGEGECYKIMTGAFIPKGGDTVAEIEVTDGGVHRVRIEGKVKCNNHIRKAGEDIELGQKISIKGRKITPYILARLISAGITYLKVYRKLRIGVLSTGGELIFPTDSAQMEKTIDSNAFFVGSLLKEMNIDIEYLGIFKDDNEELKRFLTQIDTKYDLIISSAGISSGDFDVVGNISEEIGVKWIIRGVKQKPGKPFSFGYIKDIPLFALPGNPVSSAFCLFFYVIPYIKKVLGSNEYKLKSLEAILKGKIKKRNDRVHFNRVVIKYEKDMFYAYPFESQDSHMISSISESNGFCMIPSEMVGEICDGTILRVYPYNFEAMF
ncbi:MAG: molybdopterin molybdotransferase MoeA [Calditerrivibrio sp.]|nr:molybdopterin molybdotransferase MoeA [Calditerrivibrio sp.]